MSIKKSLPIANVISVFHFYSATKYLNWTELIGVEDFSVNAVPVVNLFRKKAPASLNIQDQEHHVIIDRTQPLNYEIYAIEQVKGFDTNNRQTVAFSPMYKAPDMGLFPEAQTQHAYFSARRADRVPSENSVKTASVLPTWAVKYFCLWPTIGITLSIPAYSIFP